MIKGSLKFGGDIMEVIVEGNSLKFFDTSTGIITTIEGLKISKGGVIKEHPDLENDPEWRKKAIERLKKHMKQFQTEENKLDYVRDEFIKFGYEPLMKQRAGHRTKKW